MKYKKHAWEEEAKDNFIEALKAAGRGDWVVSGSDVVVDVGTNRNFDYQLTCGNELIALEIFRLVEDREEVVRQKSWSTIANSLAAELRTRGVQGFTILAPHTFDVPRLKIPGFVSKTADRLEAAIKDNPQADPITVEGFEIKWIDNFPDVSIYTIGPGGAVNPTGAARDFIERMLPTKNEQLDIAGHERIILVVNWALLVGRLDMVEACSLIDFSQFNNIDKVYFELPHAAGHPHLVYDRQVYAAFQPDGEPPERLEPLFISWLANHLCRKEMQAFRLVRKITERERTLLWLPARSREQLVAFGEQFLENGEIESLRWIVGILKDDPDPSVENAADDPEGKFNHHLRTKNGESSHIIQSVRARLCWLLMKMVVHPLIEEYDPLFEIVERFATGQNLYVRQHATVPLIELSRRRLASIDAGPRFMSAGLAERVKVLSLKMVDDNLTYPAVLEWVAHLVARVQDLDHETALITVQKLLAVDRCLAANDLCTMLIYFAFFREKHFKELGAFKSDDIRKLLSEQLEHGSGRIRAAAAIQFKEILDRNELEMGVLLPYLEAMLAGHWDRVVNHHIYQIARRQAADHPSEVMNLIELAVSQELKTLDLGGREVWHPKDFGEALRLVEQRVGYGERVVRLRASLAPYRKQGQLRDIYDF